MDIYGMLTQVRKQAFSLIIAQVTVVVILAVVFVWHSGREAALSVILGGLAGILPSIYFIFKVFNGRRRTAVQMVKDFYVGELIKILLSVIMLILIIKFLPVKILALIGGFITAYLAIWLLPIILLVTGKWKINEFT